MVLEISVTPYIFTFKLWNWDRLVLDGLPRPIHIEDGEKNIQWNRTTSWVKDNLVNHVEVIHDGDDYLEERTNVVKSNANRNKIITILSYLLIWAFAMIVFWFFTSGSDAMGYSLMFLWIILPVTTFIVSVVIGKNNFWGKGKWAFTLFFGVMYMLAEYGTFKMANNITFNKLNAPEFGMIVAGAIISAIGMLLGSLCNRKRHNLNKEE